ncbi:polysaccharide deacetylase family protein [Dendrosporobacter sp. 1207_IL3150]|uniref:polysaccharide deacetylase family protein n=1 Tax=Dendrosporobacter sp. 1207_IL3150 TaxID=3084054 RepID=UPI002FDB4AAB
MNHKRIILCVLVLSVIISSLYFKDFFTTKTGGDYRNITDLESAYNADTETARSLEQLKNSQEKALVISRSNSGLRHIAITFDGLSDRNTIQQILDLLHKYNAKATFFVDGLQCAEDPQTVVNIRNAGHKIENYTLLGLNKMENLPVERLVKDFSRAQKIIKVTADRDPNLLKCNDTKYTDQLLIAARACGFNSVVKNDIFLNVEKISSLMSADDFVRSIKPGTIVSIKLKTDVEPIVKEKEKTDLRPAIDKQPGLKELPKYTDLREKKTVDAVEKFLSSLKKANYTTTYVEEFAKTNQEQKKTTILQSVLIDGEYLKKAVATIHNQLRNIFTIPTAYAANLEDNKAQEIKTVLTTEPALAFTFGGLSNEIAVDDVLGRLDKLGIKSTFFVAEIEMKRYPQTIKRIIEKGHEVGIAIRPKDGETFEETSKTIVRSQKILNEQFGVKTTLVKQLSGVVADTTKEAVAALGYKLIGQSINVVQSKHKDYVSADLIMEDIFGKHVLSLARGQIVYFRMDYYTKDLLVGELMESIKLRKVDNIAYRTFYDNPENNSNNDSRYSIKPVSSILNNKKLVYQYPIEPQNIPLSLRNDQGVNIDKNNFMAEASKRYIGNNDVDYEDRMLGFSKMEARRLDRKGFIHAQENVIFLTFDDWGTDAAINKILYVLRKHNVPGAFFIITNNVLNNPNLLRSIAVQGHDIGSHSDKHKPMVIRDQKNGKQIRTQDREEYLSDLRLSYQKLRDVTGDVTVLGKPSLTRYFRPPTLAISKMGFEALFETGYEYIISGSCSTYDYKAQSVSELVYTMKDGIYTSDGKIKQGAVLVMHMGDSSIYTATALDMLLTANAARSDSDPSKFKVGRLSDYLVDGYSQSERRKTLRLSSHD